MFKTILPAAGMLALLAGSADAATWEIQGYGTTPAFTSLAIDGNDIIEHVGVSMADGVLSGGRLNVLAAGATVSFWYLGSESGYANRLLSGAGFHDENDRNPPLTVAQALGGPADLVTTGIGMGLLDMAFTHDGGILIIANATNPDTDGSPAIVFAYLDLYKDQASRFAIGAATYGIVSYATDLVLFALDDGGAGPNYDFDDYVGVAYITPIPAAAFLLGPALAGLGYVARRNKKVAAA